MAGARGWGPAWPRGPTRSLPAEPQAASSKARPAADSQATLSGAPAWPQPPSVVGPCRPLSGTR